jgi:hypothetical protein
MPDITDEILKSVAYHPPSILDHQHHDIRWKDGLKNEQQRRNNKN